MPIFEIQGNDGQIYEVDAPSIEEAAKGFKSFQGQDSQGPGNGGVTSRPDSQEQLQAAEDRGLSVGPQVPQAGIASDASGIPLDQNYEDVGLEQEYHRVQQSGNALEGVRFLRDQGQPLPEPRMTMYDGLSEDEARELYTIYRDSNTDDTTMLTTGDTYNGTLIPVPPQSAPNAPGAETMARFGENVVSGLGAGAREIASTAGHLWDLAGDEDSFKAGEFIDERSPKLKTGSFSDSMAQEVGREIPAWVGAAGVTGRGKKIATELGLSSAAADEDQTMIGTDVVAALIPVVDPNQELSENELVQKLGTFVELSAMMGAAHGAIKTAGGATGVLKRGVYDPIRTFFSDKKSKDYITRQITEDLAPPLRNLNKEQSDEVVGIIQRSLADASDSEVPTDTLTGISEGLRKAASDHDDPAVVEALEKISRAAEGTRKSSTYHGLPELGEVESLRTKLPGQRTDEMSSIITDGNVADVPELARRTGEVMQAEATDTAESLVEKYSKTMKSADEIEDAILKDVNKLYEEAREPVKDLAASEEIIEDLRAAGIKIADDATYEDVMKAVPQLNKTIDRILKSNSQGAVPLMDLKDRIYDSELEDLVESEGLDLGPIKAKFDEARQFYRDEYADVYRPSAKAPARGLAAISGTRGRSVDNTSGQIAREQAARQTLDDTFGENVQTGAAKQAEEVFQKRGSPEDLDALAGARDTSRLAKEQQASVDRFYDDTISSFVRKGSKEPSKDYISTQLSNLFKENTDKVSDLVPEMKKRLSPKEFKKASAGLKQGALDWIKKSLTDEGGKITGAKTTPDNIGNAFAVLKALPLSDAEKGMYGALEAMYRDIGGTASRMSSATSVRPTVANMLTSDPGNQAQGAVNRIVSFMFGVLNSTSMKIRTVGAAGFKSVGPSREQHFQEVVDELISNPDAYSKQLERIMKLDRRSDAWKKATKGLIRSVMRPAYKSQRSEDFEKDLEEVVNEVSSINELEEMENVTTIERTPRSK